jgi:3-polyprenyl-4-hydroxybenzoate decarboxylase
MDTLDYTGPKVNEGSKGLLLGVGKPIRTLPAAFSGSLPQPFNAAKPFCRGCLVLQGPSYRENPGLAECLKGSGPEARTPQACFNGWPLLILVDDIKQACASPSSFLWTVFTRFEPGADIGAWGMEIKRNHIAYQAPIIIDARMKPWYPEELECDPATADLVSWRWKEYFPTAY